MSLRERINGLLIDCSRVLEHPAYYFHLVDLLARWGMNTLVLHFSDDHGLAIRLPGLEHLAMPHAMSAETVEDLIDHAAHKDVSIIPEIETFGHTRYITDHPDYQHLAAWPNPQRLKFNAIDPLSLDAFALLKRLIDATCELFPSHYIHVGCDEVNLGRLCKRDHIDPHKTWADHVNRMFALVGDQGRVPMFWADHPINNTKICEKLDKDAVAVDWHYEADANDAGIKTLKQAGFRDVVAAPGTGTHLWRFQPADGTLENIRRMSRYAAKHDLLGVITTQWQPAYYVQRAMDYGIAYAAVAATQGGKVNRAAFDRRFARETFDLPCTGPLRTFLSQWTTLATPMDFCIKWAKNRSPVGEATKDQLAEINELGRELIPLTEQVAPKKNVDVWEAMVLAARCSWICSEAWMVHHGQVGQARKNAYNAELDACRKDLAANWDQTRFPDDPSRNKAAFRGTAMDHALLILRRLPKI